MRNGFRNGLLIVCFFWAACGTKPTSEEQAAQELQSPGLLVYRAQCATCHQNNGQGMKGNAPTLVGAEWVTGEKPRLIRMMLHGVTGKMTVNGETFDTPKQAFAHLDDQDLADVLTFVRKSWGNQASEVSPTEVRTLRLFHQDKNTPWKVDELNLPAQKMMPALAFEFSE